MIPECSSPGLLCRMCCNQAQNNNAQQLKCNCKHKNLVKAILYGPMFFLTYSIVLNSIAMGRWWLFPCYECIFGFGCCAIHICFIPCNNALQILVSLIGITYQMHRKSPIQQVLWSSCKVLWHWQCTYFISHPRGCGHCCAPYPTKCLPLGQRVSHLNRSVLSDKEIYTTHHTLLSIYPQWTCLGTHDMLSKPLLMLSQASLNIYIQGDQRELDGLSLSLSHARTHTHTQKR